MDKEILANLIYIVLLLAGIVYYYFSQNRKKKVTEKPDDAHIVQRNGDDFIESLSKLGYFRYASPDKLKSLEEEVKICYQTHGVLGTLEEEWEPLCNRLFTADDEFIFEEGGIIETLKNLKPAFETRGLKLNIDENFEEYQQNVANQWIVINGRKYVIYDNIDGSQANWGIATERLVRLLNNELEQQGSEERVYQISGGNDSQIVFLTPQMFDFINSSDIDSDWKPFKYKEVE